MCEFPISEYQLVAARQSKVRHVTILATPEKYQQQHRPRMFYLKTDLYCTFQ